jgi:putative ABC transport system permease protein
MIWRIAWKNIWRNKVRSLVIIMAISLGLLGGIFSSAVMKGMSDQRVREAISRETSHIQVHNPGYSENNDIKYTIPANEVSGLAEILDPLPGVAGWSPRIKFLSMASTATASTGVMVYGVIPGKEERVSDIHETICDSCGRYLETDKAGFAVIGRALMEKLKLHLHSKIVLSFQDLNGNLTGTVFRVCGIYHTSNSDYDGMNIFVRSMDIAPLLAIPAGEFHEIAIRLKNGDDVPFVQALLIRHFPGLAIRNWKQVDPILGTITDLLNTWLYLFMVIILIGLTFGIINTMLMVILERIRELGMLSAIGMNKQKVFFMIMLESVFLSFTGGITGMLLSLGLISITAHTGINLSRLATGFEKLGYNPVLYPGLDLQFFIIIIIMVILIGILASVYPAMRALRLNPAEAIRNE